MKKIIIVVIVLVLLGGAYWLGTRKSEAPVVVSLVNNGGQEVSLVGVSFISIDIGARTIEAQENNNSATFLVSANKAVVFSYTDDPSCTVSCAQPETLVSIDDLIKRQVHPNYELKGVWVKVNGQNIFEAS